MESCGKRIRGLRKVLRLSAGEFGRLVGVEASTIARWEQGITEPTHSELAKIWQNVRVDLNWLVTGGNRPNYLSEIQVQNGQLVEPLAAVPAARRVTAEETRLLNEYRAMAPHDRAFVQKVFESVRELPPEPAAIDVTPAGRIRRR